MPVLITGTDDTWEYAIGETWYGSPPPFRVTAPPPQVLPGGEGWASNTRTCVDGWQFYRDVQGVQHIRYFWKRPIAYAAMTREVEVIAATDPTTAQLETRNDELDRLRAEAKAWRDGHLTLELELASTKRALDHMTKCNSDRFAELEQIRALVGGQHLAYVVDGASALKLVQELMAAHRVSQEMNRDLNNFAAGDQQRAIRDASKIKRYEDALSEVRRGFYSTKTTLVYEDRTLFDRVYAMVDDLIPDAMERADKLREKDALLKLAPPIVIPSPIPMFLTCPMCNTRHIDEGNFALKPHHTHACQNCGLTWRPAIGPTVGVQYLPGFKNEGK